MTVISSAANDKVKLVKHLQTRRWRERTGLVFVEGIRLVEDALTAGVEIEFAGYFPPLLDSERGKVLYQCLRDSGFPVYCFDKALKKSMMQTVTPQDVFAVVRPPQYSWKQLLRGSVVLVVNGVQDPGNLGTILRTADALGVGSVITTQGTCDVYNPKALRSAMGSTFKIPIFADVSDAEVLTYLRNTGFSIVASALTSRAQDLTHHSFSGSTALVIGNEGAGVAPVWLDNADSVVFIPMESRVESLNVAVATAIMLYEIRRQLQCF